MNTQLVILICYVAALLGISFWSTRLIKNSSGEGALNYLLAGRNMPTPLIVVMLVGLAVGGASTVGVAERAYTQGFSAGWYNAAWGLGGIAAGLFAADVSTAVGLLMGCSTLVLEDVVKKVRRKPLSASREVMISRLVVLMVSLMSFGLALTVVGILKTITTALAVTTSFTILILAGLYCPRLCKRAAGVPIILASLVLWIVWTFAPSLRIGPELIYVEWIVCGGIFILCALLAKEPAGSLIAPAAREEIDEAQDIELKGAATI